MAQNTNTYAAVGRFAPSPSGRMHLGNVYTALVSWLSTRSKGGQWILRIEDLDPQRSKRHYAEAIEDDLHWLGLDWDEGGIDDKGDHSPYSQSRRDSVYEAALKRLTDAGLTYKCQCRRADIMATQAPHESDGRIVYAGTCRPAQTPPFMPVDDGIKGSTRLYVPDSVISFTDAVFGQQSVNLSQHCGDFVLRRADGEWAYQLAVVVDDALMGVTEVVRGCDLLLSTAQQIYLYGLLGYDIPRFVHLPLLCNSGGVRLSKRDMSLSMDELRRHYSADEIIGHIAHIANITDCYRPCSAEELAQSFDLRRIVPMQKIIVPEL